MTLVAFKCFLRFRRRTGKLWFSGRFEHGEFCGRYINLPFLRFEFGRHIPIRFEQRELNAIERVVSELI